MEEVRLNDEVGFLGNKLWVFGQESGEGPSEQEQGGD